MYAEMLYEYLFLEALLFTVFIESLVLFLIIRLIFRIKQKKISSKILLFTGILCSFATLPYLWFLLPLFFHSYLAYVIFGEIIVFILESTIYYFVLGINMKNAAFVSFACNAASFLLGLIIF